ncbi:hypothetical protein Back11_56700 [Paenibacillus baekrokdamisoli]|uniref:Uncharacterized protein n=1 Tax=Paenibacillus baekrokdamisoli TaxID=1712516 RepID=A0A3G9J7M3_9BACL|nr:hypothetical protein Back11_56700 [Paenibacillus baekrokdamisoli]
MPFRTKRDPQQRAAGLKKRYIKKGGCSYYKRPLLTEDENNISSLLQKRINPLQLSATAAYLSV